MANNLFRHRNIKKTKKRAIEAARRRFYRIDVAREVAANRREHPPKGIRQTTREERKRGIRRQR